MKKTLLVIQADNTKFTTLNNHLSDLHYLPDKIQRSFSLDEALSASYIGIGLILADLPYLTPDISTALHSLQKHFNDIPVIVLSDIDDKSVSITAIKHGAQDFLVNGNFDTAQLEKAILFAIERKGLTIKKEYAIREYKRHFENGPIPMWIIDAATMKFLVVNNAAVEKYGYSKEEFSGMTIKDIRPPEDVDLMIRDFKSRKADFFDAGYWRHLNKKGEVFYAHVYSHTTQFANMDARLSFAIDVNEKVLMEKNNAELVTHVREQKEQLDNLLFSVGYAIWSRRADNLDIIYAYPNSAYYKLFGYTADEMIGNKKLFFNNVHPDDRKIVYNSMQDAIAKGSSEIVFRYAHLDGSIKTMKSKINLKKGSGNQPDTLSGVTCDISKEKQLTDTIRNTELNLLATINNTKDMIWSINSKLEIVFCNKSYQDSVYELAGVIPKPGDYVLDWGSESFFNTRKKDYERALAGESFTIFVEEYYNGSLLHTEISSNPIYDDEVNIVGVICIARDMSEQKNQFVQIQRQNEKLREIAWIQSHKVRGPVASILGLASLFNYEPDAHENNVEILEKLKIATNDLDMIIREVVDKTRYIDK